MSDKQYPDFGGYCTSPKLFLKRIGKPDPHGILSEQIFGPISSFKCGCGFLRHKTLDGGKTCPKCGIRCIDNESRLTTFGKIKTLLPFIKTTKKNNILKIIGRKYRNLIDPKQCDANLALSRFIYINSNNEINIIDDVSSCPKNSTLIPFKITGIFSLLFVLKFIANNYNISNVKEIFDQNMVTDELDVFPPDLRPIFPDPDNPKTLFFEKINKYYISILNSNRRNALLNPLINEDIKNWEECLINSPAEIIESNSITNYDQIISFYQFYIDEIYAWCFERIKGKEGLIRSVILSRTLEFSARTVAAVDPSVKPYEVSVPKATLFILWLPYFINYLVKVKQYMQFDEAYYKVAIRKYYEIQNDVKLHTYFLEFLNWFINSEEAKKLI